MLNRVRSLPQSTVDINKTQALGYIRVSDRMQEERASLLTQTRCIEKYCSDNNIKLNEIYSDIGTGLTTTKRDGFIELLKTVQPYNWVIVYELSRFARDQADTINTFRDLVRNKHCTFICLNPHIDSRQDDRCDFMVGLYSTVSQEESKRISVRVKSNMQRLSNEGKLITRPPFGYIQDPTTRMFLKDPEQQEVVEQLQVWYLTNISINEMAKRLNAEGKSSLLNNNKKTKIAEPKFTASNVSSILRGYGIIQDNKTPPFTYHQRVENWNNGIHKPKIKRIDPLESEIKHDNNMIENNNHD